MTEHLRYLSHHVFSIDESFKPTHGCTTIQGEDVLGLNGHTAQVGVRLEDDDLREDEREFQCFIQYDAS